MKGWNNLNSCKSQKLEKKKSILFSFISFLLNPQYFCVHLAFPEKIYFYFYCTNYSSQRKSLSLTFLELFQSMHTFCKATLLLWGWLLTAAGSPEMFWHLQKWGCSGISRSRDAWRKCGNVWSPNAPGQPASADPSLSRRVRWSEPSPECLTASVTLWF